MYNFGCDWLENDDSRGVRRSEGAREFILGRFMEDGVDIDEAASLNAE